VLCAAVASYRTTARPVHEANHFTFGPIWEVAWIFFGIFATMAPALDYLQLHAGALGIQRPVQFYWLSGCLSSVLDNAPTYVAFLSAALGLHGVAIDSPSELRGFLDQHGLYTVAISLGSVFFGAMTYIGNGPNFMVKAIADHAKVHTPSFFGYIGKFSFPVLLPVFGLIAICFLYR
jgi:Na+/H+ antiporter NhaD/arsenite permease-like protein